ncbi:MAG: UDP-glucose 4-epimerase GalE [Paenibacillus sp.]|nr:UDP-glucose 4-epimerase GalE [Paenibacillus sp.]
MTILVTGGAGYIGSHTVAELISRGENVVVVDNLVTGHRSAVSAAARFYEGDIRDASFLNRVFAENEILPPAPWLEKVSAIRSSITTIICLARFPWSVRWPGTE